MKVKIRRWAGVGIIQNSVNKDEFLFNQYDKTYKKKIYHGRVNLFGGNYEKADKSPLDIFLREIREEFSWPIGSKNFRNFAAKKDINKIRKEIIRETVPYNDFFCKIPPMKDLNGKIWHTGNVIISVFLSQLSQETFDIAKKNLYSNKNLVNEGMAKIITLDELISGKIVGTAITSQVMTYFTKREIPDPEKLKITCLGKPRASFSNYFKQFDLSAIYTLKNK